MADLVEPGTGARAGVSPAAGCGHTAISDMLARAIEAEGPMPVARWMALCNAHYYATRDPLGVTGDFTTAPEITQMFGEMVGAWAVDLWRRAGSPEVRLVELGPGRGTLMADILRVGRNAGFAPPVHLVETSPALRAAQAERVPGPTWHDAFDQVPDDRPLLVVANEFFDALPVRQLVRAEAGWRERMVGPGLAPGLGSADATPLVPPSLWNAPPGSVVELSPASTAIAAALGERLRARGGAALVVDYGHAGPVTGDTLQAVRGHAYADPFADPGEVDLTAHVDFAALARAAAVPSFGPVGQGRWLAALGIGARAATLAARGATGVETALRRLVDPAEMGDLFKVLALTGPGWPRPEGFA